MIWTVLNSCSNIRNGIKKNLKKKLNKQKMLAYQLIETIKQTNLIRLSIYKLSAYEKLLIKYIFYNILKELSNVCVNVLGAQNPQLYKLTFLLYIIKLIITKKIFHTISSD